MKRSMHILVAVTALVLVTSAFAQSDAQKSFTQLKSLAGVWEGMGTGHHEHPVKVSFRETAGGSALLSEIHGQGPENMISMFHLDGADRLIITHYCGAGNQPRMLAGTSPDGKVVTFTFFDGTNIDPAAAGHMQKLVLTMLDANHHTEEWTFDDHGKELKELFDLRRKM